MTSVAPSLPPSSLGFTLLETLVVITVLAALMGLAAPSMRALQLRWEVRGASQALESSLVLARSEAIRRAGKVAVRRLDSSCAGGNTDAHWNCGWRVFVDSNGNGTQDSGEATLQTVEQNGTVQIVHSADATVLRLDRYGGVVGITGQHSFALAPAADPDAAGPAGKRMLCLSPGARIKAEEGSTC